MAKIHIKKGDTVKVLSGDDRGKSGRVLRVFPKKMKAIVEGCRLVSKHVKPNVNPDNPKGGVIEQEAPIHVSNLMVLDPKTNKPTRTSRTKNEKGFSVRVSKKSGVIIL
ncbi:MAG: 50S ribosomal protein L24 [Bacteroidia bacterium]|nr:50S ribosomal protein L24 [Bacteroidia bacterium]